MDQHSTDLTDHFAHRDEGPGAQELRAEHPSVSHSRLLKAMDLEAIALEAGVTAADLEDTDVQRRLLEVLAVKRGRARPLTASATTWEWVRLFLADRARG